MRKKIYILLILIAGIGIIIYQKNKSQNDKNKMSQNLSSSISQNSQENDFGVIIEKKELTKPLETMQTKQDQDKDANQSQPIFYNQIQQALGTQNNEVEKKIKEIENNYKKKWAITKGDQYILDAANKYRHLEKKIILMFQDYYTCKAAVSDNYKDCDNLSKFQFSYDLVKGNRNFLGCTNKLTIINFVKFINKLSDKISHCTDYYRESMLDNIISIEKFCDISRNSDIKNICNQFKSEKEKCEKYTAGNCDKKDPYCLSFWDFNRAFKTGNPSVRLIESQDLIVGVMNNNCNQIANNIIMEYNSLENLMNISVSELKMNEQTNKYQQEMGKKIKQKKEETEGE